MSQMRDVITRLDPTQGVWCAAVTGDRQRV